jgi:phosphoserine phosphatase
MIRTQQAMNGTVKFQDALRERLQIINPSESLIQQLSQSDRLSFSPNVEKLMQEHLQNQQIYIISGGFEEIISPLVQKFRIPSENIYANKFMFDSEGKFIGVEDRPTARSGGKLEVMNLIREKHPNSLIAHIGDGATDLETLPVVDLFIGYGGNFVRDIVKSRAHWFISDFVELFSNQ